MKPIETMPLHSQDGKVIRHYNHQTFRPEAVEAYATRQAGEPWSTKHQLEGLIVLTLTLATAAGGTFVLLGIH